MSVSYLGLSEINGPLIALEGVQDASYDEIVELTVEGINGNYIMKRQWFRYLKVQKICLFQILIQSLPVIRLK